MKREILLLSHAEEDIYSYAEYLTLNAGNDVATRFENSVFESVELLLERPYVGVLRHYTNRKLNELRMWPVRNFNDLLIFI